MIKNLRLTITNKMIMIAVIIVVSVTLLIASEFQSMRYIEKLEETKIALADIKAGMLMLRRNEKDFLARNDLKYREKFNKNFEILSGYVNSLRSLTDIRPETDTTIVEMENHFSDYKNTFIDVINIQNKIGLNPKHGLYGELRKAVHNAESSIKELNDHQLMSDMLMLRRREKDFMLRNDIKYLAKFNKDVDKFFSHLDQKDYESTVTEKITGNMKDYETKFRQLVEANEVKGLSSKTGLHGKMRAAVHKSEKIIKVLDVELSEFIKHEISSTEQKAVLISVVIALILLSLIFIISRSIVSRVKLLSAMMNDVSASRDLTSQIELKGQDEIADMAAAFNHMMDEFHQLLQKVVESTEYVQSEATDLAEISNASTQGIQQQYAETDMLATSMNEMAATVQEVARHAQEAANVSANADNEAQQGKSAVQENRQAISALATDISETASVINQLSTESENIGTVLNVIQDIAEQTNLLALNAAIEAARAGEQGRGFAVVADEVRGLAQRSQQSTKEIQEIVDRLQSSAVRAVEAMDHGNQKAQLSVEKAESVSASLDAITSAVGAISDMNIQIASASEEQAAVADEINRNVVNISDIASQTTNHSAETTSTSKRMALLAQQLTDSVAKFKL